MPTTKNTKNGVILFADKTGVLESKITFLKRQNIKKEIVPLRRGDTTQLAAICDTLFQCMEENPLKIMPNPKTAPTIECVVETGHPLNEAMFSHVPAANNAAIIP
jgi:hypothetical protein